MKMKNKNKKNIKTKSMIIMIICGIILFVLIIYFLLLVISNINYSNNKTYTKYMKNDNYSCKNNVCVSNNKKFDYNQNYEYIETINFNEKTYVFDAKNAESKSNYIGKYLISDNTIIITFVIDDITFKGTYDITNQYISLNPICDKCSLDEINNIYKNYRDKAYNDCISLAKESLTIINNEEK